MKNKIFRIIVRHSTVIVYHSADNMTVKQRSDVMSSFKLCITFSNVHKTRI